MLDLSKNTSENDNLTVYFLIACLITKNKLSESICQFMNVCFFLFLVFYQTCRDVRKQTYKT